MSLCLLRVHAHVPVVHEDLKITRDHALDDNKRTRNLRSRQREREKRTKKRKKQIEKIETEKKNDEAP